MTYLLYFFISVVASLVLVGVAIRFLTQRDILDNPNDRSSHEVPTPRGGGLGVLPVVFAGLLGLAFYGRLEFPCNCTWWGIAGGGALLALVSWMDDMRPQGLPAWYRLLAQIVAVALPLCLWPLDEGKIFPEYVPILLERVMIGLAWIWFLNLYNFMDGINAITGMQTFSISMGLVILTLFGGLVFDTGYTEFSVVLAGAALGFLFWNARKNAKIFLGDVGSITIGYIVAWLLFVMAMQGYVTVALLLPLPYLVDATYTLLKRTYRRHKIWEPHRTHFYQQATGVNGMSHLRASAWMFATNILLIGIAYLVVIEKIRRPEWGLALGLVVVICLLRFFAKAGRRAMIETAPNHENTL